MEAPAPTPPLEMVQGEAKNVATAATPTPRTSSPVLKRTKRQVPSVITALRCEKNKKWEGLALSPNVPSISLSLLDGGEWMGQSAGAFQFSFGLACQFWARAQNVLAAAIVMGKLALCLVCVTIP